MINVAKTNGLLTAQSQRVAKDPFCPLTSRTSSGRTTSPKNFQMWTKMVLNCQDKNKNEHKVYRPPQNVCSTQRTRGEERGEERGREDRGRERGHIGY